MILVATHPDSGKVHAVGVRASVSHIGYGVRTLCCQWLVRPDHDPDFPRWRHVEDLTCGSCRVASIKTHDLTRRQVAAANASLRIRIKHPPRSEQ